MGTIIGGFGDGPKKKPKAKKMKIELSEEEVKALRHIIGEFIFSWQLYTPSEETEKLIENLNKVDKKLNPHKGDQNEA